MDKKNKPKNKFIPEENNSTNSETAFGISVLKTGRTLVESYPVCQVLKLKIHWITEFSVLPIKLTLVLCRIFFFTQSIKTMTTLTIKNTHSFKGFKNLYNISSFKISDKKFTTTIEDIMDDINSKNTKRITSILSLAFVTIILFIIYTT